MKSSFLFYSLQNHIDKNIAFRYPLVLLNFFFYISGRGGVGKSQIYQQLRDRIDQDSDKDVICAVFKCGSEAELKASLQKFSDRFSLNFTITDESQEALKQAIQKLFQRLGGGDYAPRIKCLLFDNAKYNADTFNIVKWIDDTLCRQLAQRDAQAKPDRHKKWKIYVTTRQGVEGATFDGWLNECRYMSDKDFHLVRVDLFTEAQTIQYLSGIKNLTNDNKKILHRGLGGLPVALKVARKSLDINRVIRYYFFQFRFVQMLCHSFTLYIYRLYIPGPRLPVPYLNRVYLFLLLPTANIHTIHRMPTVDNICLSIWRCRSQ